MEWLQMFARKYQRIAAEHCEEAAVFLEILGDENCDTRVGRLFRWICMSNDASHKICSFCSEFIFRFQIGGERGVCAHFLLCGAGPYDQHADLGNTIFLPLPRHSNGEDCDRHQRSEVAGRYKAAAC